MKIVAGATLADSKLVVEVHDARLRVGETTIERVKTSLIPVGIPSNVVSRVSEIPETTLLEMARETAGGLLAESCKRARYARGEAVRRIIAAIHERLAFSVSVFALTILGAALGIVLRGSHLMTAFGIAFVPLLFVIIMIVTGKQMSRNPGTHELGVLVIWSGIVVVAALDVLVLTRLLRR